MKTQLDFNQVNLFNRTINLISFLWCFKSEPSSKSTITRNKELREIPRKLDLVNCGARQPKLRSCLSVSIWEISYLCIYLCSEARLLLMRVYCASICAVRLYKSRYSKAHDYSCSLLEQKNSQYLQRPF